MALFMIERNFAEALADDAGEDPNLQQTNAHGDSYTQDLRINDVHAESQAQGSQILPQTRADGPGFDESGDAGYQSGVAPTCSTQRTQARWAAPDGRLNRYLKRDTSRMESAGIPKRCACSRNASALGASYKQ